ncbi:MAG: formate--tetrahydrofolate ligase [Eubacteriales bacterium]|nr:formate--tetrahydrofolate ligase [Eubacteriales bacterium]
MQDIDIARAATLKPITEVLADYGFTDDELACYGRYKAKIYPSWYERMKDKPDGKLVLVTAVNPTPAGEGKTTVSIGLAQALNRIGRRAVLALREPSLGPCFGIKGGAAGGGYAQVVPMDDLNLHFTGDLHALTAANNLLAAMIDNHIHHGNALNIDTRRILWKRCLDLNDRALRNVVVGLGRKADGFVREDHFTITVASELMAILCLADGLSDLQERLGRILVAYSMTGEPVYAKDLRAVGAMTVLLKDAMMPNAVQTLEHTPAIVHGGPFANIAHGCNSVTATRYAMKMGDYAITEAGFGADLGAEKFMDIKARAAGLALHTVVIVATVRALKYNGGMAKDELGTPSLDALRAGMENLHKHIENIRSFGYEPVVAVNRFPTDTPEELAVIENESGTPAFIVDVHAKGGAGAEALARFIDQSDHEPRIPNFTYPEDAGIEEKINKLAIGIYGADGVDFTAPARRAIKTLTAAGYGKLPICMAKTQYSLSDDPKRLGRPTGFRITVRDIYVSAGAGMIVALTGDIMTMPGLPKIPAAEGMAVDEAGHIQGLS